MSNENIVYSHELVVRFEQDADNNLSWLVQPDDSVGKTSHASYEELAEAGAPLSVIGIRVLLDLLGENLVDLALHKANVYLWRESYRQMNLHALTDTDDIEGAVVDVADDAAVVH